MTSSFSSSSSSSSLAGQAMPQVLPQPFTLNRQRQRGHRWGQEGEQTPASYATQLCPCPHILQESPELGTLLLILHSGALQP